MPIKLNKAAVAHAKKLIKRGDYEMFKKSEWAEEQATPDEENNYINHHTTSEFGLWFLGITTDNPTTKKDYEYPYGDFNEVHLCGLQDSLERAIENGDKEIVAAAQELIALIKAQKPE